MSDQETDSDWEGCDVEEIDEEYMMQTLCLFCEEIFSSPDDALAHCRLVHEFDFMTLRKRITLDAITYIKLINYIRIHKPSVFDLQHNMSVHPPWNNDLYMKPAQTDDPLLTFDIESYIEERQLSAGENMDLETVTLPKAEYQTLVQKLTATEAQLENAWDRIERMKETAKNVLYSGNHFADKSPAEHHNEADNYYFSSYDHFGIHHEMLQDKVRTLAYQDAILGNKDKFLNKKVMDLGCGTAILSLFAARAGASKVIAVDKSDVIYQAMDIIRENQYDEVIDLFKGRVEEAAIPEGKVDIIVSEWMGYFLLFEGMLDSVLYARDKYLAPDGLLLPDRCTLSLAAMCDPEKYDEYVTFWSDVYGFKMSVMKREVIKEANVEAVKADMLCSHPVVIKEFDLLTCTVQDTEFVSKFDLVMTKNCKVTALVGYFDCMFERNLSNKVILSTSPLGAQTHWKQTVFLLPETVEVKEGEHIACRLSCRKNRRDPRTLIVKIDFGNTYNQYYLA